MEDNLDVDIPQGPPTALEPTEPGSIARATDAEAAMEAARLVRSKVHTVVLMQAREQHVRHTTCTNGQGKPQPNASSQVRRLRLLTAMIRFHYDEVPRSGQPEWPFCRSLGRRHRVIEYRDCGRPPSSSFVAR